MDSIDARFTFVTYLCVVKERVVPRLRSGRILSLSKDSRFYKPRETVYINFFSLLVETTGIEPVTSSLQSWRSPN